MIAGSGRMKLDAEIIDIERLDAIRVAPDVTRDASRAGPDGLSSCSQSAHDTTVTARSSRTGGKTERGSTGQE